MFEIESELVFVAPVPLDAGVVFSGELTNQVRFYALGLSVRRQFHPCRGSPPRLDAVGR